MEAPVTRCDEPPPGRGRIETPVGVFDLPLCAAVAFDVICALGGEASLRAIYQGFREREIDVGLDAEDDPIFTRWRIRAAIYNHSKDSPWFHLDLRLFYRARRGVWGVRPEFRNETRG